MKKISFLMAAGFLLLFNSCKNTATENTAETTAAVTDSTPAAFNPFKLLLVRNSVKDFNKFKALYLSKDSLREAYGMSKYLLGRGLPDSNSLFVFDRISDVQKTKDFTASPALKAAMKDAGTTSMPQFSYLEIIRLDDTPAELKDRVMVVHKVKDFDTWLKAFDAEGKATRAQYGLMDRAVGRDLDDPNIVYLAFAVTDMAKAKARSASPELKKIMEDAGVIGAPTQYMYKVDEYFK